MISSRPSESLKALVVKGLVVLLRDCSLIQVEAEAEKRITVQMGHKGYEGQWVSNVGFVAGRWLRCSPAEAGDRLLRIIDAELTTEGWQCQSINGYLNFKPKETTLAERLIRFEAGVQAGVDTVERRLPPGSEKQLAYARYRFDFLKQRLCHLDSTISQNELAELESVLATDLFLGLSEWLAEPNSDKGLKHLIDWICSLNRMHHLGRCSEAQLFGIYKVSSWAVVQLSQSNIIIEG